MAYLRVSEYFFKMVSNTALSMYPVPLSGIRLGCCCGLQYCTNTYQQCIGEYRRITDN